MKISFNSSTDFCRLLIQVTFFTLCLTGIVNAESSSIPAKQFQRHSIEVDGKTRYYLIYEPKIAKPNPAAILVLHGGTQSMDKIFSPKAGGTLAWLDIADRDGVVLLVPNGVNQKTGQATGDNQNWDDLRVESNADVQFLQQLVVQETQALKLDAKHIYISGASNGGMMTYRMLIEKPELFAAGVAFIANLPSNLEQIKYASKPVPMLIMNGTEDPIVKWDGGAVANGKRGELASTKATLSWWQANNNVSTKATKHVDLPDITRRDFCKLSLDQYNDTDKLGNVSTPVWLYTAKGGGHTMPSIKYDSITSFLAKRFFGYQCKDAEGAELAWQFLKQF
jgi:polyhydroxybutyrate depolymerase